MLKIIQLIINNKIYTIFSNSKIDLQKILISIQLKKFEHNVNNNFVIETSFSKIEKKLYFVTN